MEALAGLILDVLVGEPPGAVHPVVGLGRCIEAGERGLRRLFRVPPLEGESGDPGGVGPSGSVPGAGRGGGNASEAPFGRGVRERWAGGILAVGVVGLTYAVTGLTVWLGGHFHPALGFVVSALWVWVAVAPRNLAQAARRVSGFLLAGDLEGARKAAGMMVSRSTGGLPEGEVIRAAVESVAENIVDAIIAPLFYAALGGGPAAMAYRAANTLDAMIGYRNVRYLDFGRVAARLDDALNWIPARITGVLMLGAAGVLGLDVRGAFRAIRRDARRHPSPNGGIPEAAAAGALGVRLGGWNLYHGRRSFRPYLGPDARPLEPEDIPRTVRLMAWTTGEMAVLILLAEGMAGWR
ncbi:cobalamin biosynthesis protein CobD [Kyrpidia spormannii]|nr:MULTISPECIES: adenosylcobinamide-phosphate synthase CbiB [Kyrpidia]ATY84151.1 cobalamin biosynthesis protein CobD [Kyrpidia spormannii]MCL6576471.1 adenosylcobinamide-phosphate synthase CbiB [Kyrpidia sp.]